MKSLISLFVIAGVLSACSRNDDHQAQINNANLVEGQLIVKMTSDTKNRQGILGQFAKTEAINEKNGLYLVSDKILKGKEELTADRLSKDSRVEFAEPNYRVHINQGVTQDPYFMKLWGLKNYGQDAPNGIEGTEGADIGVLEAWKKTHGSKEVRVAVLDTGCWYKHPDLTENIWVNRAEKEGVPGVDDDKNGYTDDIHGWDAVSDSRSSLYYGKVGDPDPADDQGHGTHVSGTIGAVGGNGIGVVGINQTVSIACVKFLDSRGSGSTIDEYRALEYILANEFDVVNGSYGGGAKSKLIESMLREGGKKGILFVFAAGNDSSNNDTTDTWPTNYGEYLDNVISVAATDSRDQIADFSNFGQNKVHIAAPGVSIMSTVPPAMKGEDEPPYAVFSGTSMATPHVAGAAALLLAAEPALKKKPGQIRERLMATAEFKPQLAAMVASGRLNVARAIANDRSNPTVGGTWEEISYPLETPRNPQSKVDNAFEIHVPGAKAIQVHLAFYQVESGFDTAMMYDANYRPLMNLVGEGRDVWSPIMLGDTARIKFSNSMVAIDGSTEFANFNSSGIQVDKVKVLK